MAKHRPQSPLIPRPRPQSFRPPLEAQRAMLEKARDDFRAQGYQCEINIEAFSVQEAGDGEVRDREVENLEHKRDNCYASARHFEEKLATMPKPKKNPPSA